VIALDASALLAFLFREQGAEHVLAHLSESCLSAVNLAEVIGRFVRDGYDAHEVLARLATSEVELVPFTPEQAAIAAKLLPKTSRLGCRSAIGLVLRSHCHEAFQRSPRIVIGRSSGSASR